jgi:hypothetical protein
VLVTAPACHHSHFRFVHVVEVQGSSLALHTSIINLGWRNVPISGVILKGKGSLKCRLLCCYKDSATPVCELAKDSDVRRATAERGQNADIYTVNLVICGWPRRCMSMAGAVVTVSSVIIKRFNMRC